MPTNLERGNRNTNGKRYVKKVISSDNINNNQSMSGTIWRRNELDKIVGEKSVNWNSVVKPILADNCATERLTKKDEEKFDSFHRKHLNYLIGKHHIISNSNLHKRYDTYPMMPLIVQIHWKLYGYVPRLDGQTPNKASLLFLLQDQRNTLSRKPPYTCNNDIKRNLDKIPSSTVKTFEEIRQAATFS